MATRIRHEEWQRDRKGGAFAQAFAARLYPCSASNATVNSRPAILARVVAESRIELGQRIRCVSLIVG